MAWPRRSTTARSVRTNARREVASGSASNTRCSRRRRGPRRCRAPRAGERALRHRAARRRAARATAAAGRRRARGRAQQRVHLARDAARADQHQPLAALGVLIGELHRHAAAQRVADHRHAIDAEHAQQIAHGVGVGGDRVVGARLVGAPMAEQVGRDHRVVAREPRDDVAPRVGAIADAVDEQERRAPCPRARTLAGSRG